MRVILYILDGISALKIRSFNNEKVNKIVNKNIPLTYIDKLYRQGFSAKYCYGFDTTQASFYAFFTGNKHYKSKVSIARDCKLLDYDRSLTIPALFKKNGFKTHYFSNNCVHNPAVLQDGFGKVVYDHENYDMKNLNIKEDFEEYFGINKDENLFLTIHDFYTHDQNGQYSKGKYDLTMEEYEKLIVNHANILKNNLEAIKFDKTKDYLFLISDHGMTVDSKVFKEKGDDESLWSLNSKELKSRVILNILGPDIEPFEFTNVCTLREVFFTFIDKFNLDKNLNNTELNLLNRPNQKYIFSLNGGNAAVKPPSKTTFHQFLCVSNDRQKWIYQDNFDKDIEYYDLKADFLEKNPVYLQYNELPNEFKKFIEEYQSSRSFTINYIYSLIAQNFNKNHFIFLLRNYKKIPKAILKRLGVKK